MIITIMSLRHSPSDEPVSRISLILRIQENDQAAWNRFVYVYSPLIYAWCRRSGLQSSDAHDVSQDTLLSVSKAVAAFKPVGSFRGWLWRITRNKILDHFKRQSEAVQGRGGSDFQQQIHEIPDQEPDEESGTRSGPDSTCLRALELIRQDFDESTWLAFQGMALDGKSAAEVALELGWAEPDGSVTVSAANRVRQAKRRVFARLQAEFLDLLPFVPETR